MIQGGRGDLRLIRFRVVALLGVATLLAPAVVRAQFQFSNRYELSEAVYLDEVDNAARTHLTHLDNYIQGEQWDEALNTLRLLLDSYGDKLIEADKRRYISVRDFCHQRLCELPAETRARYRAMVDAQAKVWFDASQRNHDSALLFKIIERAFASSWGDDALDRLAEIFLERGDYSSARGCWQAMLPPEKRVDSQAPGSAARTLLVYPDTSIPPATINARLTLVSILEGPRERAHQELQRFQKLHPTDTGRLAGKEGKYSELLEGLLAGSTGWAEPSTNDEWPTFAGSNQRTKIAPYSLDLGAKQWDIPLSEVSFNELVTFAPGPSIRRVTNTHPLTRSQQWLLSYHPIVVDGLVFFNTSEEVYGYELSTGKPAWGQETGVIFHDALTLPISRHGFHTVSYGVPRYSITADRHRLYARMGSPLTTTLNEATSNERRGYLVCLDLKAQGRLLWKTFPEQDKLAFEGSPVVCDDSVYIAVRRSDVRPQAHVACLDADTGQRRWIRQICSAETIGRGQYEEATTNLLTLQGESLYLNTNLGAVAKLSRRDGHIHWIRTYREKQTGDLNQPHAYLRRDLTPCVYDKGRLFVAPSDSEPIHALNAATGELLWDTRRAPDVIHLLGVGGGNLVASGDRIYWINCETGKVVHYWPDGPSPKGFGRGILAANRIYWPTRNSILVFDQRTGQLDRAPIDLRGRDEKASGGNLLLADRILLIAAATRLVAYGESSRLGESKSSPTRPANGPLRGARNPQ